MPASPPLPIIQVRSNCFLRYSKFEDKNNSSYRCSADHILKLLESRKTAYKQILSSSAIKRMSRAIHILVMLSPKRRLFNEVSKSWVNHRLAFITLTISNEQIVTLEDGYNKGLARFLNIMRKRKLLNTYVWKVEVQKRGQIHYHITTNSFIHYQTIKDVWNNIQFTNGWLNDYKESKGHYEANSTDVHSVKHVKDLAAYLSKEFCKSIQNNYTSSGKKWDCSLNLRGVKYFESVECVENVLLIDDLTYQGKVTPRPMAYCEVIHLDKSHPEELLTLTQIQAFNNFKMDICKS